MSPGAAPAAAGEVHWTEDEVGPLLVFTGRIDRETVRRFRLLVPPASWPARADLSGVTALDVPGLELLVHLARKPARTGSRLELLAVPEQLRPAIERAGLSQLLPRPAGS
jgi:ABC-type transporter Mla MlaB component